jgi:hypothetical protein
MNIGKELHIDITNCSDIYHCCDGVKIVFGPGKDQKEDAEIWDKVKNLASKLCSKK